MNQDELNQVSAVLAGMAELAAGKALSHAALTLFLMDMKPYTFQAVMGALNAHRRGERGRFMPTPADIIEAIDGKPSERATHAWATVYNAIGRVGPYQSVEFADPLIHACIEQLGGWAKLCMVQADEVTFKARDFERLYAALSKNKPPAIPKYLPGLEELQNGTLLGYKKLTPIGIGNGLNALEHTTSAMLQCSTTQQDKDAASVANGKLLNFKPKR